MNVVFTGLKVNIFCILFILKLTIKSIELFSVPEEPVFSVINVLSNTNQKWFLFATSDIVNFFILKNYYSVMLNYFLH